MSREVAVAGELYVDLVLGGFDSWPQPGQEAFAREFRKEVGGGAAITACGLAMLGTRASLFGIVGADHREWVAARLGERHVETAGLAVDAAEPTGFTVAVSTPRDRAFFTYRGANRGFERALARSVEDGIWTEQHVHLAYAPGWETAGALFDALHANGCTVSLDAGWHEEWLADRRAAELLRNVDIFFPNQAEAARMTGETDPRRMLSWFHRAGVRCVALKLGANGAALLRRDETWFEGRLAIEPCDTTGAGDCFDAGFLHAWLRSESPQACLRTANICGALSCEAYGGIAGFPTRERVARELERWSCEK